MKKTQKQCGTEIQRKQNQKKIKIKEGKEKKQKHTHTCTQNRVQIYFFLHLLIIRNFYTRSIIKLSKFILTLNLITREHSQIQAENLTSV